VGGVMRGLPELIYGVRIVSGNISLGTNTETETSSFLFYFLSPYVKMFRLKTHGQDMHGYSKVCTTDRMYYIPMKQYPLWRQHNANTT
jgi:hypothetical protein